MATTSINNDASMDRSTRITSFGLNLVPMAFLDCLLLTTTGVGYTVTATSRNIFKRL
jgi:hypothetical protein